MQPVSGARDLNPQQVEINHLVSNKLSTVFKLWGYEEISPPYIERLETLMAGDAIANKDILKVVADEPLGLRPEMTASISRVASTRLKGRPRPLRLWTKGTIFKNKKSGDEGINIEENEQIGIELFGVKSISAEIELLSLLLESLKTLNISKTLQPTLLIGHTELMQLILSRYESKNRNEIKNLLINLDQIGINNFISDKNIKVELSKVNKCRGLPKDVLTELSQIYGNVEIIQKVNDLLKIIEPISNKYDIKIQLDPTFQPNFELYNGFIFQLTCKKPNNHVVIAKGGRYDKIVSIFSSDNENNSGVGFSFSIDNIRELINDLNLSPNYTERVLIAYSKKNSLDKALQKQREFHRNGLIALLELEPCNDKTKALELLEIRNCDNLEWLD